MSDLNEASQGPSTDSPVSGEIVEAMTNETTLDDDLDKIWESASGEESPVEDEQPETPEAEPVEAAQEPAPELDLPTHLPSALKEHWGQIPEAARAAIEASQMDMSNKVSASSREIAGLKPIRGALEGAIQANPAIANMKPEDIATQIPALIEVGQRLNADPVTTILQMAQKHGVLEQIAQKVTGQGVQGNDLQLQQEVSQLRDQVKSLNDPNRLKETFDSLYRESTIEQEITKFAGETENWAEVETHLPQTIPLAQNMLGEDASPRSILEKATELAVTVFMPNKAPKPDPAPEAEPEVDPEKVQKAKDAKSVNVKAKSAGKGKAQTLDDELSAIYDKAAS